MTLIYDQEKTIKAGTEFFLSVRGHKGFYYPDRNNIVTLSKDISATRISWTCGSDEYAPYRVDIDELKALSPSVNVVWLEKE